MKGRLASDIPKFFMVKLAEHQWMEKKTMCFSKWFGHQKKNRAQKRTVVQPPYPGTASPEALLALNQAPDNRPLKVQIQEVLLKATPKEESSSKAPSPGKLPKKQTPGTGGQANIEENITYKHVPNVRYSLREDLSDSSNSDVPVNESMPPQAADSRRLNEQWLNEYSLWHFSQGKAPSFREYILTAMEKKKMDPVTFYTAADLDRKLFSRMKKEVHYHPSKDTAIRCCLALHLDIDSASYALALAGYSLSWSLREDLAVRWCIQHRIFRVYEVMEVVEELRN